MSYILEALANSEQARQQIAAAPKYSLLPAIGEALPQRSRWPYALAGALLVNAAVLQVWLRAPLSGEMAAAKVPPVPQVAETAPAPAPVIAPMPLRERALPEVRAMVETPVAPAPRARSEYPAAGDAGTAAREPRPRRSRPQPAGERRSARSAAPAAAVPSTAPAAPAQEGAPMQHTPKSTAKATTTRASEPAVAANAIPAASAIPAGGAVEIPPALQQEMPALAVAGFIRDEGSSSMVIVNDRLVREGEEVAPGLKLEKILNDGLIFNFRGYSFKR